MWIDRQAFPVLQLIASDPTGREALLTNEVTDIVVNAPVELGRFVISAAGVRVEAAPGVRMPPP